MINHIVMFRIDRAKMQGKIEETLAELVFRLDELPAKIPEILSFEIGKNICSSERAMDLVLVSTFDTEQELNNYQKHTDHREVVSFIQLVCSETIVVDYEI